MEELRTRCPEVKMVALSVHDQPGVERAAVRAGCDGFVLKRDIAIELLATIDSVMN